MHAFVKAIEKLKRRNQSFVNKNGVTPFSTETDEIIETTVEYYNNTQAKLKELEMLNQKLNLLLSLYSVPVADLMHLPNRFLLAELIKLTTLELLPPTDIGFICLHLRVQYIGNCDNIMLAFESVRDYQLYQTNGYTEMAEFMLKTFPYIKTYIKITDTTELLTQLTKDYYVYSL